MSSFSLRRDHVYFLLIAIFGLGGAFAIHLNAAYDINAAKDRFRTESHTASLAAASIAEGQFASIYQNLRTISRLPSVVKADRHATNINQDGLTTIQELYNNLASNVDVSEVYIVPRTLNADLIDPVTSAPEAPILMFDNLITGDDDGGGGKVTERFEAEIYEYHLLRRQMAWYGDHVPNIKATDGFNIPMISGAQVVTCDNSVYNITLNNSDRTGMIFSVPFFGPDGNFKGTISAIIRVKALRAVLPATNFALVNPAYGALLVSPHTVLDNEAVQLAAAAKPDSRLIYSEVLPLPGNDPRSAWSLWAELPNSAFYARPDVRAVGTFEAGAYTVLAALMLGAVTAIWLSARNTSRIDRASRALAALAGGDLESVLEGAEAGGPIGRLATAFAQFRDALAETRAFETRAAADRDAAQSERMLREEERALTLATTKHVVQMLATGLIKFANGDLGWKIKKWFGAEFKTLRMDFNLASENMEATMRRVMTSTRNVEIGANQIHESCADLAHQMEQQAEQIEETAASLDEITGTVRQTSEIAKKAASRAAAARVDATASSGVVRETMNAMSDIETSAQQIANIIGVIDEIAFQTNLLALNAGVEAARAGAAGRGFAVVATEVRALAKRSADAAKEIKVIISGSGEQVGKGVKLVTETGQTLLRITGQISLLTEDVGDIAAAAQHQASELDKVNAAVSQIGRMTHQNATMVEQSADAGNSLSAEAVSLTALVSEFTLTDPDAPVEAYEEGPPLTWQTALRIKEHAKAEIPAGTGISAREPVRG